MLLDEILAAIERSHALAPSVRAVWSAKFLHPVRPGDELEIEFTVAPGGDIRFHCWIGAVEAVTGVVRSRETA